MGLKSDMEIAQKAEIKDIRIIASKLGLNEDDIELYGKYKSKVDYNLLNRSEGKDAKLILVTAINPTPRGRQDNNIDRHGKRLVKTRQEYYNRIKRAIT